MCKNYMYVSLIFFKSKSVSEGVEGRKKKSLLDLSQF